MRGKGRAIAATAASAAATSEQFMLVFPIKIVGFADGERCGGCSCGLVAAVVATAVWCVGQRDVCHAEMQQRAWGSLPRARRMRLMRLRWWRIQRMLTAEIARVRVGRDERTLNR